MDNSLNNQDDVGRVKCRIVTLIDETEPDVLRAILPVVEGFPKVHRGEQLQDQPDLVIEQVGQHSIR